MTLSLTMWPHGSTAEFRRNDYLWGMTDQLPTHGNDTDLPLSDKVIITDSIEGMGTERYERYLIHALCLGGSLTFDFNGNRFTLGPHDLMIVRKGRMMENLQASADLRIRVIYVDATYVEHCTPQSNYGMKGQVALFLNPVMHLNEAQFALCMKDFDSVEYRHRTRGFVFYEESLRCALQLMILDFFDFHAWLYGESSLSPQYARVMEGFFSLLDSGVYRTRREVTWYASELCVSAKYLSEICKKVSGHSANFWINRYTALDISRLLRDRSLTFVQISDMFHFSSPAYFSRYVQHNLGVSPTGYRE